MNKRVKELLKESFSNNNLLMVQFNKRLLKNKCQISVITDNILEQKVNIESIHIPYKEYKDNYDEVVDVVNNNIETVAVQKVKGVDIIANKRLMDRLQCNLDHM